MMVFIALLFAASQLFASTLGYDGFYVYGVRIPLVSLAVTAWTLLTVVGITGQKP